MSLLLALPAVGVTAGGLGLLSSLLFRRVVPTNMVHIVQYRKKTTSFGTGQQGGNVYYRWPSQLPLIGVTVQTLPVSNIEIRLEGYEAYDKDRVPFRVDVVAFFRIQDTAVAAGRSANEAMMREQLTVIVQGAVRKVLASDHIDSIMVERAKFGKAFTDEVQDQLLEWGVEPVKSMELMDIRDSEGSQVIANIMAKKTSHIERESRIEVANNHQAAQEAEIAAQQAVDIKQQDAERQVGERTADKNRLVGIAEQRAEQEIKAEEAVTAAKAMEVTRVEQVKQAEITRDAAIVAGEQDREVAILEADGQLEATKRRAEGTRTEGEAKADAEKAMQMAPVSAQIALAKEIGENPGYQSYLAMLKAIEGYIAVGGKQAEALSTADVKIIANAGSPVVGADSVMGLLSPSGGTSLAGMLEAIGNMPEGRDLLEALKGKMRQAPAGENAAAPVADSDEN